MSLKCGLSEFRALGVASLLILLAWVFVYYQDRVDGNPGEELVKLFLISLIVGVVLLEYFKPWWGLYIYLALWPFMYSIRQVLVALGGPVWGVYPEAGSEFLTINAPLTSAILIGSWLRLERDGCIIQIPKQLETNVWVAVLRAALLVIVVSYIVSCFLVTIRIRVPAPGWVVVAGDWSNLRVMNSYSVFAPVWSTLNTLPSLLLGLFLLNYLKLSRTETARIAPSCLFKPFPTKRILLIFCTVGLAVGILVLLQLVCEMQWPFVNDVQPSGPFENRNLASPLLVICGLLFFQVVLKKRFLRVLMILIGVFLIGVALFTGSRGGFVMLALAPLLLLLIHPSKKKFGIAVFFVLLAIVSLKLFPFKMLQEVPVPSIQRVAQTLSDGLTPGLGWDEPRVAIYKTALNIWIDYPLVGAGPMSFVMLSHLDGGFGQVSNMLGESLAHAHNIPLQLLSEVGVLASVAWVTGWIVWPLCGMIIWRRGNFAALTVLLLGIGSQFDYLWRAPGMLTFSVILLIWALSVQFDERKRLLGNPV